MAMALEMVSRDEWGAQPPKNYNPLKTPIKWVTWGWTATDSCRTREECEEMMRFIQRCHMNTKEMVDIKYNFLIGSDGTIYEGRGWLECALPLDPQNDYSPGTFITIARIGMDFDEKEKTPEELAAWDRIIKYGIENKYVDPEYDVTDYFMWMSEK